MKPFSFAIPRSHYASDVQPRAGGASLDVLRFLAASFILLFHYGSTAPVDLATLFPIFKQGWLATDFFLFLSGYILSRAYGQRLVTSHMRRTHFFLRRFARLWPSHILVLLAFGAFVMASTAVGFAPNHAEKYGAADFFAQAFLVHGWGMMHAESWNTPTWTLSVLLVCYALFSLYIPYLYKRGLAVMIGLSVVVLLAAHGLALTLAHHAFVDLPFSWALLRAIPLFLLGNLIERMTAGFRVSKTVFWISLAGAFAAISGLCLLPRNAAIDSLILVLLGSVLAVSGGVTFHENIVTHRMGRASFALFLTHSLVGAVWFGISPKLIAHFALNAPMQWVLWGAGVLAAVTVAFLFDAVVDKPLSQWVSKLSFVKGGI
ncbi:acyltransferase family protein [Asticcacaulis taihuensis]|uniref:Peptidoglycan/LPS O-acetylase OafA/YrhL, contains acyltransferase and SGNH-hydrolase domains n=1 Tax=Asticcacaulis taihuensis TaxID=260084 RepID=A0A1G4QG42_9CAUL|nr:acyltransferase [Asticcacaulis taihuensis]SCW43427.1 Peptidoglycan/LPS O-acetylase OafA/YrhL, contains acyltransferase and SGNH-hydrolase domains [Asticcacaulis taihuensis]